MRARQRDAGFTLVEALAALAISAIAAAGLMSALGSAGLRSAEADIRSDALAQARAVLAEAVIVTDTNTIPRRGKLEAPRLAWTVTLGRPGEPYPGIQQVDVEVTWTTGRKQGATRLAAYRNSPT
jgi:prepilin-type N-terminal cleavage/methylation domain-containing protein